MRTVKVYGYSERGIFNSIVYFLNEKPEHISRFIDVLKLSEDIIEIEATIFTFLIEQSFSDFGTCDLVIVAENQRHKRKSVIFIEGKIKTNQTNFTLRKHFEKLKECKEKYNGISSNIFVQLYYKHLLYCVIRENKEDTSGLKINNLLKKNNDMERKIGSNEIVKKAVDIIKDASNAIYIAILPTNNDKCNELKIDFIELNKTFFCEQNMPTDKIKCVTWEDVEQIFTDNFVSENFEYNRGQIY
jgi:hypothetical protein